MAKTFTCFICSSKECEKDENNTFNICRYGVSYTKVDDFIDTREPKVPLSTIAKNLRHEINPILQLIVQEASKLDPSLSTNKIDLNNPLSLIVGSTVLIDNFIQMITGVHEFHSLPNSPSNKKLNLKNLISTYFNMYGIIKEDGRATNLNLVNIVPNDIFISHCSDYIKYLIAILIDNAWKYSIEGTTLTININLISDNRYRLKFTNKSLRIPANFNVFEMGSKLNEDSKGFGYGLNWAKTLEANYNNETNAPSEECMKIIHSQKLANDATNKTAFQEFIINNLIIEKQ